MRTRTTSRLMKILGSALCVAALFPATVSAAGLTDIASQPLAQPAANVPPNVMVLFDDSGSMMQQYTPDYIGRWVSSDSNALCFDSLDSGGSIDNTLQNCEPGDPPIMSPQFNFQYYNPAITYLPAVNYDGTSMPSMTAAYTSNWTVVPTDGVSNSGVNSFRTDTIHMFPASSQPQVNTVNLASNFPDREWCNSTSASTTYPNSSCRTNSSYSYPDGTYGYGKTSLGAIRYAYGAPYYYLLKTTEYCSDLTLSNCVSATAPTTVAGVNYNVPAPVRFCNSTALDNCEQNYTGSYTRPKFTGVWNNTCSIAGNCLLHDHGRIADEHQRCDPEHHRQQYRTCSAPVTRRAWCPWPPARSTRPRSPRTSGLRSTTAPRPTAAIPLQARAVPSRSTREPARPATPPTAPSPTATSSTLSRRREPRLRPQPGP